MDLLAELYAVADAFDANEVPYAVAGGWALAVHGAARATTDLDVLVRKEDVERSEAAVRPLGFRHRAGPRRFPDGMEIARVSKITGSQALTLDFLVVGEPLQAAFASRARFDLPRGPLMVISREALVQMKLWAGRPQDLADVARLTGDDR